MILEGYMLMILSYSPKSEGSENTKAYPTDLIYQDLEDCQRTALKMISSMEKDGDRETFQLNALATSCQPVYYISEDDKE
jgi:hypothetical protein